MRQTYSSQHYRIDPPQWPTIHVIQPIEAECREMPDFDNLASTTDWTATKLIKCDTCDYHTLAPFWKEEWQCGVCEHQEIEA